LFYDIPINLFTLGQYPKLVNSINKININPGNFPGEVLGMSILIKNVKLNGQETNIYIDATTIIEIGSSRSEADHVIDGTNKAVVPGMVNAHTHAAMTLLRGYADDMKLFEWLNTKIWPLEGKLTADDVYWGARLACLEMIKSGTTTFNDMYWHLEATAKAVDDAGIRGVISGVVISQSDIEEGTKQIDDNLKLIKKIQESSSDRVTPALGPHAIYTVSPEMLAKIAELSRENELMIHFHLAETKEEIEKYIEKTGKRPVEHLEELGFLSPNLVAAHGVWYNKKDIETLAKHDVKIVHNPISNMKLSVGSAIKYQELRSAGITVSLGTDGCASNNNLDMFDSMKVATLLQKYHTGDETAMPAKEVFEMATVNGARSLKVDAGVVEEGKLADLVLIDLGAPEITPNFDLISNLVYSVNGSIVDTVICDGKILMENRVVPGEEEVIEKAIEIANDLVKRK
jgi:5-methylthioadenosine/S-adenosylhomocysteine deaminase